MGNRRCKHGQSSRGEQKWNEGAAGFLYQVKRLISFQTDWSREQIEVLDLSPRQRDALKCSVIWCALRSVCWQCSVGPTWPQGHYIQLASRESLAPHKKKKKADTSHDRTKTGTMEFLFTPLEAATSPYATVRKKTSTNKATLQRG